MNDHDFLSIVKTKLIVDGHAIQDDGKVSLSVASLADFLSKNNLDAIESFIRLQRMCGIRTVCYLDLQEKNNDLLAERMIELPIMMRKEKGTALSVLQENVVDISPIADEHLRLVCSGHAEI